MHSWRGAIAVVVSVGLCCVGGSVAAAQPPPTAPEDSAASSLEDEADEEQEPVDEAPPSPAELKLEERAHALAEERERWGTDDRDRLRPPPQPTWAEMDADERRRWRRARKDSLPLVHTGFAAPILSANAYDGLLLGVAAQYSNRPREQEFGYRFKATLTAMINLVPDHLSVIGLVEYRGPTAWTGKIRLRLQNNYPYSGAGGANAVTLSEDEAGNDVADLGYSITADREIPGVANLRWYAGHAFSIVGAVPNEGGALDIARPIGAFGGLYADLMAGVLYQDVDRWPRPVEGWRAEASLRVALTYGRETPKDDGGALIPGALGGIFLEGVRWQPLYGDWLVLGVRGLVDRTVGRRPFFDENRVGGVFRDELGVDQIFTGYGVYRFGGDGVVNGMIELRGKIWHFDYPRFNLLLQISAFGEEGFVMDGWNVGPHLPSVGGSLDVILGGSLYLRPFLSVGWTATEEDPTRVARPLFGLAAKGPL